MEKNNQKQRKAFSLQRIAILFCGLFLALVALEVGLRVSGFVMLSLQEHKNLQPIKQKGEFRIMCLGESTTRDEYPPFLKEILNKRNRGIKFSVIDKGMPYINTGVILGQLEANLDKYQPDIVIAMMGCNDRRTMYYQDIPEADTWLFRHCRIYRFSRLIAMHILKKLKKEDIYGVKSPPPDQSKLLEIERSFKNAVRLNPGNDLAYTKSGQFYRDQGRPAEAEQAFKKALKVNPGNDLAHAELGQLYTEQMKYAEAEQAFKEALKFNPGNDCAYTGLGQLYTEQMKYAEAEQAFQKALKFNPGNDGVYSVLNLLYKKQGRLVEREQTLKKAIEFDRKNDSAYIGLGLFYRDQGRLSEAEQVFKKALELNPRNDFAIGGLATIYCEMGKDDLSRVYTEKANSLGRGYYTPTTSSNYRKLKQILDKRGIKLVCAQYPMRSVQPLKKIFKEDEGVVFVDNERIFKDAVRKDGYNEYFVDMFGGDFGHCTQKGNRLLAENIASTILKEIVDK